MLPTYRPGSSEPARNRLGSHQPGGSGSGHQGLGSDSGSVTVRSLDAIHLATALRIGGQLTSFVTYGKRLADAGRIAGLTVDMPTQ